MPVVATLCFVVSYVTETLTQCNVVVVAKLATLSRAQLCIRVQLNIIWPLGYKVWGVGVGVDQDNSILNILTHSKGAMATLYWVHC